MQNKWARRFAWGLGGLLALWALAWAAVPPLVKSQVEKIATEQLGRKVTLGAVDFKPWTLELTVSDLKIATADGSADQLAVKRIYIDAELQSLLRLAPVVDAIAVDAPQVKLTHLGGGKYDIDDILAKLSAPSKKPAAKGEPPKFALYNIALKDGALDFTDKSVNKTHELRDLNIRLPFLSNLDSKREVTVAPQLGFVLNGSRFDSTAQGTPFTQTRKTDASIAIKSLDLAPYLVYWPAGLPVRLQSAVLQADLRVAFEQTPSTRVSISGLLGADKLSLVPSGNPTAGKDAGKQAVKGAAELFGFDSLRIQVADAQPLAQSIKLASVELVAPHLSVERDRAGRINLQNLGGAGVASETKSAKKSIAKKDQNTHAPGANDSKSAGWKLELASLKLAGGQIDWRDQSTTPAAALALSKLQLEASAIAWPMSAPLQFTGSSLLAGSSLTFAGSATDKAASVTAALSGLPLKLAAPYLAQFLEPSLAGNLSAELGVAWMAPDVSLDIKRLTLADVALNPAAATAGSAGSAVKGAAAPQALASLKKLEISNTQVDLAKSHAQVGRLALSGPRARVERSAQGRWMFERWMKAPVAMAPNASASPGFASKPPEASVKPWSAAINEIAIDGGVVAFQDFMPVRPVQLDVSALNLQLKHLAYPFAAASPAPSAAAKPGAKPAQTAAAALSPLLISARLASGRLEPGKLDFKGALGLAPVAVRGALAAERLPLHALEAYAAEALNIELLRADTSFKGQIDFAQLAAGPRLELAGDLALEDFRANTALGSVASGAGTATVVANASAAPGSASASTSAGAAPVGPAATSEELLSWKALAVRGLQISMAPGNATRVQVRETALSDFFARIGVSEQGRINLQDIVKSTPPVTGTTATTASTTSTTASGPAAIVNIGPMALTNGRVLFSDRFIKPNYSANLTELNGKLSAFSSVSPAGSPQLADLELRGRAQGTASLEVLGKLNPLAKPLALDITGKVRDLELPPLSTYSVKYTGHGIERGKLSVDVAYLIKPDGQLTASNKIVLNQLTFGDKVDGAPTSLPVKLAVALLADRNGVIDLNLPVSGSINDPQFSIGGIIFKVIINLVVKAITSPFALLSSAFGGGGGEELSTVYFVPGSAAMVPEAAASLDKVAKALTDRPSLKLTVVGTSSVEAESEAYKRERLQGLVRSEKRRDAVIGGASSTTRTVVVSAEEYPALLKEVYKRTDMPKPRNAIGLAKDQTVPEMEALLMANIPVTEDLMRDLAVRRGVAVKEALATRQLPLERLFLGAAKTVPPEAKWTPRAEMNIAQ